MQVELLKCPLVIAGQMKSSHWFLMPGSTQLKIYESLPDVYGRASRRSNQGWDGRVGQMLLAL